MKQLGGLDELFFAMEKPNQCMHVAVLGIYDPSTAPGGKVRLRDIMAHIRERLDVAPEQVSVEDDAGEEEAVAGPLAIAVDVSEAEAAADNPAP